MSMRMTVYGISKKFPTIINITCEQLNNWIEDESKKLVSLAIDLALALPYLCKINTSE